MINKDMTQASQATQKATALKQLSPQSCADVKKNGYVKGYSTTSYASSSGLGSSFVPYRGSRD